MISLFIDTSSSQIILAIVDDSNILSYINEENDTTLSDRIFPLLEKSFNEAQIDFKMISTIYVVNGPGSFTGIRVGVTIAKTMAWALNIPIIPISSLEVIASTHYEGDYLIPYIDARRGFVFAGIYDNRLDVVEKDSHTKISALITKLPKKSKFTLVGYDEIVSSYDRIKPEVDVLKVINKHKDDPKVNPHTLLPNYLKLTEAEENLKK